MVWKGWEDYQTTGTLPPAVPKRKHKYGAVPTVVDGIRFDSKKEAERWAVLRAEEKLHDIQRLTRQVKFGLHVVDSTGAIVPIGNYVADFVYERFCPETNTWDEVVEDVKGVFTAMYRWKKKHFETEYGQEITEI